MSEASIDRDRLVEQFEATQRDLSHDRAVKIAAEVLAANSDVAEAARTWSRSGVMPDAPEVEGHTPSSLAEDYLPSQVFTVLAVLAHDPKMTPMLRRLPKLAAAGAVEKGTYT